MDRVISAINDDRVIHIAMIVACLEGKGLVFCKAMEDIFDLFPDIKLTWLKGSIQVSTGTKVLGCVMNILGDPDDQRGEIDAKLIFYLFDYVMSDHSVYVCVCFVCSLLLLLLLYIFVCIYLFLLYLIHVLMSQFITLK